MPDSTPDIKDLTGGEILSDVPELLAIAMKANEEFSGQPAPTTATGWIERLGFAKGGLVYTMANTIDTVTTGPVTLDMVAQLLGMEPDGLIDGMRSLAAKVIAQAAD